MRGIAQPIAQGRFERPEAAYGRFNFHPEACLDAFEDRLLEAGSRPGVVVLSGPPGIGRSYVCDAATFRADRPGHRVKSWHLDLEAFDPDADQALSTFFARLVDHEAQKEKAEREAAKAALASLARTLVATDWTASLIALLWQFEDPARQVESLLDRAPGGIVGVRRKERETLALFLERLSEDQTLLVHLRDASTLRRAEYRAWWTAEANKPNRVVAISCDPRDPTSSLVAAHLLRRPALRFELGPLAGDDLRARFDERWVPHEIPRSVIEALITYSNGHPGAIALKTADLVQSGGLVDETDRGWRCPDVDGHLAKAVATPFAENAYAPILELSAEHPEVGRALESFLVCAALCGRLVPVQPILEHLELTEDAANELIDLIDDELVDKLGWLRDHQGTHPGLGEQGIYVYEFTSRLLPELILTREEQLGETESLASALLGRLFRQERVRVTCRPVAHLMLALASRASDEERERVLEELSWWVGSEEANALATRLEDDLRRGKVDPEIVWERFQTMRFRWPPYRRLALIEAYARASEDLRLPMGREPELKLAWLRVLLEAGAWLKAIEVAEAVSSSGSLPASSEHKIEVLGHYSYLLGRVGRHAEALERANEALHQVREDQHFLTHWLLGVRGLAEHSLGRYQDAQHSWRTVLHWCERVLEPGHPQMLNAQTNLAFTLNELGEFVEARHLNQTVLDFYERALHPEHPNSLSARTNLAFTLNGLGEHDEAKRLNESVLDIRERILGPDHPDTLSVRGNLARTLHSLGEHDQARTLFQRVVASSARDLGPEHPLTLMARANLAVTLEALGEYASAHSMLSEVVATRERVLGTEHPNTVTAREILARVSRHLSSS